jgi:hypothetical protein
MPRVDAGTVLTTKVAATAVIVFLITVVVGFLFLYVISPQVDFRVTRKCGGVYGYPLGCPTAAPAP